MNGQEYTLEVKMMKSLRKNAERRYIKAMGDEDSGGSDTNPKPSPKVAARRESYLKALSHPSELTTLK